MDTSAVVTELTPRPSYGALRILLPLHVLPLAAVPLFYRGDAVWQPLLLAGAIALSWFYVRRHAALGFGRRALTRFIVHEDGEWTVEDAAGQRQSAHLAPGSAVFSRLVLLNLRLADGHRRSRLLLGDEVGAEPLRKLRVYLLSRRHAP
ncbi:MAG TPA: protein YgfX [Nevskiaceae bacterium]|nr:protein YgfX [Nevskiaceae bacterium]